MKKQIFVTAILSVFFFLNSVCLAVNRLVPSEYSTIQAAINASVNDDTVIISPGTYTGTGNRDIDFGEKAITVQSTDPEDPCVVAATIIDCQQLGRGFYFHNSENANSVLSGLTIKNGKITGISVYGGGIYCVGSSPTIANCNILNNTAYAVVGSYVDSNSYGGGIACVSSSYPTVINCNISGNLANGSNCTEAMSISYGGGIYCGLNSTIAIYHCKITGNTARGGRWCSDASFLNYPYHSYGGGIYIGGSSGSTIINCLIANNQTVVVRGEDYEGILYGISQGAGIYSIVNVLVKNCTISGNYTEPDGTMGSGGGIYGPAAVSNSIIWGNLSTSQISGSGTFTYCDVQGGKSGTGNINSDPLFATGPFGNYYLSQIAAGQASDSPCVNAGSDTAVNLEMDELTTRTDWLTDTGIVDMGYHYSVAIYSPDIDENLIVDFFDYAILADDWRGSGSNLDGDITIDSQVDFKDLLVLANAWLDCLVEPASNPYPADGATNVVLNVDFNWTAGEGALEHDIYLGIDANAVAVANRSSAEFMDTVPDVNFAPSSLDINTAYFWRIDEVGPRCTAKGDVWNFRTWLFADPNLVGWWKFDETSGTIANDSSGHGNNGTVNGAVWTTGKIDGALNFDGNNDYVSVPDNDDSLDMNSQMTITAWVKWVELLYNLEHPIACKQPSGTASEFESGNYEFFIADNGILYLKHQTGTSEYDVDASYESTSSVTEGVWQHVAVTLKKGDSVKFYINGEPAGTSSQTETFGIVNNEPVRIGKMKSEEFFFYGAIDDIRIYNKALSDTEVQQLYNPLVAVNPNPVNGATNVSLTQDLSWTAGSGATSHDVYFGTVNPPPFIGNQTGTTYDTGTMVLGTTYYWRIDEINAGGTTTGFVWSFTTVLPLPGAASNPNPADSATDVSVTQNLSWTAGSYAASHDVYFGTVNPPPFIGNQTSTTYDTGTMDVSTTYYWRVDEKNASGTTTGTVWSFTTALPPGSASNPNPADLATDVSPVQDLSWTAGSGTTSHDVYLGTANPPPLKGNQTGTTYDTGIMTTATTYYWRIDEKGPGGTTIGTVWNFTTGTPLPGAATNPVPANGAENIDLNNVVLSWTAGIYADSRDVYLGTVFDDVNNAGTSSPEFKGNQTATSYDPCNLDANTTYYWRIDEKNITGTTKGNVWNFKTGLSVDPNLVGWWKFDEGSGTTVTDSAGSPSNGTVYGATWITGQINGALNFDGSNDYVGIPDNDNSLDMDNQMTIAAWIKPNNISNLYCIAAKQPSGTAGNNYPGNYEFRIDQTTGYLRLLHQTGTGTTYTSYISTSAVTAGQWQHVAVTLKEGDSVKFYINSTLAGTFSQTVVFGIVNNNPLRIGSRKNSDYWFNGAVDDVRVYNRTLLDTEIQQIYLQGNP